MAKSKQPRRPQRSKRQRWMERTLIVILDPECRPLVGIPEELINDEQLERPATRLERAYLRTL